MSSVSQSKQSTTSSMASRTSSHASSKSSEHDKGKEESPSKSKTSKIPIPIPIWKGFQRILTLKSEARQYDWRLSYRSQASLVQLQNTEEEIEKKYFYPKLVAFTTGKLNVKTQKYDYDVHRYIFNDVYNYDDKLLKMKKSISSDGIVLNYDLTINDVQWERVIQDIKDCDYVKTTIKSTWLNENDGDIEFSGGLKKIRNAFHIALTDGMTNGSGKNLVKTVIDYILDEKIPNFDSNCLFCTLPSKSDRTNGDVQYVNRSEYFDRPGVKDRGSSKSASGSSHLSYDDKDYAYKSTKDYIEKINGFVCKKIATVVPDVVAFMGKIPIFVVSVELKVAADNFLCAKMQCSNHLLTQMHNQDIAFGIVLSGSSFAVLFMKKEKSKKRGEYGYITLSEYEQKFGDVPVTKGHHHTVQAEKFTELFNWIYWILDYYYGKYSKITSL